MLWSRPDSDLLALVFAFSLLKEMQAQCKSKVFDFDCEPKKKQDELAYFLFRIYESI